MGKRLVASIGLGLLIVLAVAGQAFAAATAAAGFKVTDFATGFANSGGVGPVGLAFDATNHLYVMDYVNGTLYKFGTSGGAADLTTRVNAVPITGSPAGIAFAKDGRLYLARQASGDVVELNPTTGVVLRTVTTQASGATGIATDPLSGDLFVTLPFIGRLIRLEHFSTDAATVSQYATFEFPDGITFAPDGTIYIADAGHAVKVVGTNSTASHAETDIAAVPSIDGIALAAGGTASSPTAIFGNRNDGKITKVDLTKNPVVLTDIVTDGSRGDFSAVGPDGCLYATQTDRVIKVTNADGTCSFAPTTAVPILRLAPASSTATVGTSTTLAATLTNVTPANGHVVTFTVTGANPKVGTATTDSSGKATFSYSGTHTGQDTVTAATAVDEQPVSSNSATVTWTAAPTPSATPRVLPATGAPPSENGLSAALALLGIATVAVVIGRLMLRPRSG